jgi:hypothetical protein
MLRVKHRVSVAEVPGEGILRGLKIVCAAVSGRLAIVLVRGIRSGCCDDRGGGDHCYEGQSDEKIMHRQILSENKQPET